MDNRSTELVDIELVKDRIMNSALVAAAIMSAVAEGLTTYRALTYGLNFVHVIQTAIVLGVFVVTYLRKRLSLQFKINILLAMIFVTVYAGMYKYGLLIAGKLYIVAIPLFLAFVYNKRRAVAILMIFVMAYGLYAYLYTTGLLELHFDANEYITSPSMWALDLLHVLLVALAILFVGANYSDTVLQNYKAVEAKNLILEDREKKFRILFESSNDGILLLSKDKFIDCNQKTLEMFECTMEEIKGQDIFKFRSTPEMRTKEDIERIKRKMVMASTGDAQYFNVRFLKPNGTFFIVSISLNVVILNEDKYFQAVLRDVTDQILKDRELEDHRNKLEELVQVRTLELEQVNAELVDSNETLARQKAELEETLDKLKDAQDQLIEKEKMASVGMLANGVAHEINNPMNYIKGGVEWLNDFIEGLKLKSEPKLDMILNGIDTGVNRVVNIIDSLNHFSQSSDAPYTKCHMNDIIEHCLTVIPDRFKENISITKVYTNKPYELIGNEGMLHQMIYHILFNAVQSIEGEGEISILTFTSGKKLEIEISDTGSGISKEDLKRIREPFFTTKGPGQGTGLGLAISQNVVHDHKGKITFHSKPKQGTTVKVSLPIKIIATV